MTSRPHWIAALVWLWFTTPALGAPLATYTVAPSAGSAVYVAEGVVESVRQSAIAAQVPARITDVRVRAGDAVKAGQVLIRLDARTAADQVASSQAQVAAAQAQLDAARRDYERNRRLSEKRYISQAAMEQAEASFKAAQAQARASIAQAGVASTQSTYTILTAPYAGIVAAVTAEVGDMATPGTPLVTVYDPAVLRVVAQLPESHVADLAEGKPVLVALPGGDGKPRALEVLPVTVLPTINAATHTREVRVPLPAGTRGVAPGMFTRVTFPLATTAEPRLTVPSGAIVRRPEFTAVYVVDASGRARLRQVRLGRDTGHGVEVAAGLAPGERVAVDAVAAAGQ
ncbi:MAG: efflux RND transporter periplasmic adaptor subunit [Burkholderiales bacterium]|nr:efflux RND transporter periplasmic adaptor subunit [Burkholderiales bacterium]